MESLKEYGITANYEDFKPYTGMVDDVFIGKVAEQYGLRYELSMKERAYEIYFNKAAERVLVYPWSRNLILTMKTNGYAVAVASSSDCVKVARNIECIGVDVEIFNAVVTSCDVKSNKPAPDIFLKAAELSGYDAAESVVFEDSLSGVRAAKAAGAFCIAVTTSFHKIKLKEAGADVILDDLTTAPDIIGAQ